LDTVTYSDPIVAGYIESDLVPYRTSMGEQHNWPFFRTNHIIWTPSIGLADRNGSIHYQSPGFLPPSDFLSALRIGRGRCLVAWTRSAEAIRELEAAAAVDNLMTPEALFWLSTAYFFERRDTTRMYQTWDKLVEQYPDSPWTQRTYPRPED
jgi:hypothetical protein